MALCQVIGEEKCHLVQITCLPAGPMENQMIDIIEDIEKWLPVVRWEWLYEISSHGRVRSLDKTIINSVRNTPWTKKGKILGSWISQGYPQVELWHNNERVAERVHRLIGEAFIPNPENKPWINHKNGIKTCNFLWNLEWSTVQENVDHATVMGLNEQRGSKNRMAKLTDEKVIHIRKLVAEGTSVRDVRALYDIADMTVRNICNGKTWKHLLI